jgi:hypothetical protein
VAEVAPLSAAARRNARNIPAAHPPRASSALARRIADSNIARSSREEAASHLTIRESFCPAIGKSSAHARALEKSNPVKPSGIVLRGF